MTHKHILSSPRPVVARLGALALLATLALPAAAQDTAAPTETTEPAVTINEPAPAQDPNVRVGDRFDDWQIYCQKEEAAPNGEICAAVQEKYDADKLALWIAVGYFQNSQVPIALIRFPYFLSGDYRAFQVSNGVGISIDGAAPIGFPLSVCGPNGCELGAPLDEALQTALKAGTKGSVVVTLAGGAQANLIFSLKGFTAALGALPAPPPPQ